MNGVYLYIRNGREFNWITCPLTPDVNFHKIRIFGRLPEARVKEELSSLKKTNTSDFIAFAQKNGIISINISIRGPYKVDDILDIGSLVINGICVNSINDITPQFSDKSSLLNAAMYRTYKPEKNIALRRALERTRA